MFCSKLLIHRDTNKLNLGIIKGLRDRIPEDILKELSRTAPKILDREVEKEEAEEECCQQEEEEEIF
ncbi:hypothetical protein KEJ32_04040 [Candidatus Bathyarchaeota archaeon]|nr:hypothetical protein [Candidatus Bathyarchaeota archaeon]